MFGFTPISGLSSAFHLWQRRPVAYIPRLVRGIQWYVHRLFDPLDPADKPRDVGSEDESDIGRT